MKRTVKYLSIVFSASFCFLTDIAKACPEVSDTCCVPSSVNNLLFADHCALSHGRSSLPVRFSANGYGSTDYLVGQADAMFPLKSDALHNFYIDPALAYGSDSQGFLDLGVGYRRVKNNSAILGGYLFGGYSRIDNNARLWVINPGIEALGSRWDAHLNGYVVMGDRSKTVSSFLTFNEFSGHSAMYNLFDVNQHAGDGLDAKLGYQLFPKVPLKAYVGSYFFSPAETENVLGGAVGLEYWVSQNVKVFANYTYDNLRRSVGALGLGLEMGGTHVHRSDPSVEERITDPVERYLAELGRGSAIPSQKATQMMGVFSPISNSMVFFSQTGTPNNGGLALTSNSCTFENPCGPTDLTNAGTATLSNLYPNTAFMFQGGEYDALDVLNGTNPVTIRTGQSLSSAPGTSPSTFNGGFILEGNNSLNNIILVPTANTATGPGVSASGNNVLINNSQIGSMATPFATGLAFSGNTQANLNNSTVFASSTGANTSDSAGLATNGSTINVNGGPSAMGINSTSSGPLNLTQGSVVNVTGGDGIFGVNSNGNGDFVLDNSSINANGVNGAVGLQTGGTGSVTVSGASAINLNASGTNSTGYFDQGSGPVNFSGASSITLNASAPTAFGYIHLGSADVNFNGGSSINVNAAGQNTVGGFVDAPGASGDITFDASLINVTGGSDTRGLASQGTGNLNIINNSAFTVTGGDDSIGVEIAGNRAINLLDSGLTFNGGNDSFGFNSTGNGHIVIRRSLVNSTQGNNSFGFSSSGNGNITIDASTQNFTGGDTFVGFNTAGTGSVTVSGGSAFNLTANGANSVGYLDQGSGPVNFSGNSSITLNANGINSGGYIHQGSSVVNFNGGSSINVNAAGQNQAYGFRDLSGATGDITFDASPINVTGADGTIGFNSAGTGNLNIINNSAFTVVGGNASYGLRILGNRFINFLDGMFTFTGGNNSFGFYSEGNGNIVIRRSLWTYNHGNNSFGFNFRGNGNITIDTSTHNFTAGSGFIGFHKEGSGSLTVNGGSAFNVTAGANSFVYEDAGSGALNFSGGTSLNMNAAGQASVGGIHTLSSSSGAVTFDASQINVIGGNTSIGFFGQGAGNVTVSGGSAINVTGGSSSIGYLDAAGSGLVSFNGANSITVNAAGQNLALGFATTVGSGSNITHNGTNITVFGGDNSRGGSFVGTGLVNLTNTSITLNAPGQTGVQGLLTGTTNTGNINLTGTSVIVNSGNNAQGFNVSGTGTVNVGGNSAITVNAAGFTPVTGLFIANTATSNVTFDSSQITVTGGDATRGVNYFGSGNVGFINGSIITATGGNDVRAFSDSGTGAVNLTGAGTALNANATGLGIGFTATAGVPSVITSNGAQINVTGGDTTRGFGISGTGNINLTNTLITVNAATNVANTVSGILINGGGSSALTISGGQINVLNGNNANGIAVLGTSTVNILNSNLINVNGNGLATGININTNTGGGTGSGGGSVTGNNINVSAVSTGGQALGLFTSAGSSGSITIGGSDIDVSGGGGSAIRQDLGAGTITVTGSVCMLNGSPVAC